MYLLRPTFLQFVHHVVVHQCSLLFLLNLCTLCLQVQSFNCIYSLLWPFSRLVLLQIVMFDLGRRLLLIYFAQGTRLVGDQPIWWSILRHFPVTLCISVLGNRLLSLLPSIEQDGRQWAFWGIYGCRWMIFVIWTIDWSSFSLGVFPGFSTVEDVEYIVHSIFIEVKCFKDERINGVILWTCHQ